MQVRNFYLIRPKQRLRELASGMDDESSRDLLTRSELWESAEGGKTLWSSSDYSARAKLAFLINLRTEYAGSPDVDQLFTDEKVSVELFDKYWEIEELDLVGNVDQTSGVGFPRSEVRMSGMANVDAWVAKVTRPS